MAETIYVKGINTFPKNEKAPDFVLGSGVITPNVLIAFIKEHQEHLTVRSEQVDDDLPF